MKALCLCSAALLAMLALLLAGCAAPPKRPLPTDVDTAWRVHQSLLADLSRWRPTASLAVRAGREGGQAYMDWRQRDQAYDIRLSGPVGSGAVRLSGEGGGATLRLANGERLSDPDPARLLYTQLGWWIPVDSLRYWAVGLPDPAMPAVWSLDDYGRLATLRQNGWEVRFETYAPVGTLDLPERMTLTGHDAKVRLLARRWTLEPAEAL